ncbi:MAG: hypothetical protein PF638_02310 [Candidatus Delongbacteria bacterium]|jgi:hypothetical protein|nr:hypothetical protein [Candidatus Delongbacteria bacterium]
MKKTIFIIFILNLTCIFAGEFDLFKTKKKLNQKLFRNLKHNKLRLSYTLFPSDYNKVGFAVEEYITKKFGFMIGANFTDSGSNMKEKAEIILAGSYRFTKRVRTWIFQGNMGLSFNDDVYNNSGTSKGFRMNHLYGRFTVEYFFANGLGFDYSMVGRMPIEIDVDEDMMPQHSIGILFNF